MPEDRDTLKYASSLSAADFRRIMEQYGDDVWSYAYFLTGNKDTADELAQETFVKAFRGMASYRGESSVKTWLLAIARNSWYTWRRSAFMRKMTLVGLQPAGGRTESAEETYMRSLMSDDIWTTVLRLPVKYREVLILRARYELSMEEIGRTLGLTVSAVKSRLFKARRKMSRLLEIGGHEGSERYEH
ncbi:RNA polymerase sigma factor [Paenibacillus sp. MWE-103]|uniref:RNA polymerase sigma factor n=1 Tax=Paenibacillus artemisiicola TaxID=1172618 RepID=A0ABS3W5J5_9BACL|nr:RNA polymerase sigma factor [Paenibacillus artemisiicola]MBO7743563.1 RNA polymerase sigma factor [Paenibacillus artemisiicola]